MSIPELILTTVVLVVGLPAAWKNPTAGALVLCWVFAETLYLFTGNGMSVQYYLFPDLFVIAVIFSKPAVYCINHTEHIWDLIKCAILELSVPDRIVLAMFPILWLVYTSDVSPYHQYWLMWWLSIAQFIAAGFEGFIKLFFRSIEFKTPDQSKNNVMRKLATGYG